MVAIAIIKAMYLWLHVCRVVECSVVVGAVQGEVAGVLTVVKYAGPVH